MTRDVHATDSGSYPLHIPYSVTPHFSFHIQRQEKVCELFWISWFLGKLVIKCSLIFIYVKGIDKYNVPKIMKKEITILHIFIEHTHLKFKMVVEEASEPLELITSWPPVAAITSTRRFLYFSFYSSWQNYLSSAIVFGHLMCMTLFKSFHSLSLGLRSGLWLGHSKRWILFFWSHSVVDLLWCFGSLFCCIIQLQLTFRHSHNFLILGIHLTLNDYLLGRPRSWCFLHHTLQLGGCFHDAMQCPFYARCSAACSF